MPEKEWFSSENWDMIYGNFNLYTEEENLAVHLTSLSKRYKHMHNGIVIKVFKNKSDDNLNDARKGMKRFLKFEKKNKLNFSGYDLLVVD